MRMKRAFGIAAALLAWGPARRFGWFVMPNGPSGDVPPRLSFWRLAAIAALAVPLHLPADAISGFGNLTPFWPFGSYEISLNLTSSFDVVIFSATLAWHFAVRWPDAWDRRRALRLTAWYLGLVLAYLAVRWGLIAAGILPRAVW